MQVIGLAPAFVATDVIAARSTHQSVSEWAQRVVRRHVRRTSGLHRRLASEQAVVAAAALDRLPSEVVQKIVAAFKAGDDIYSPDRALLHAFVERALDTMDFMESLPLSDRRIRRIERLSWSDAEQMSADWHAALARVRTISKDVMAGVRKISEFPDGSFFAELTTAAALKTEGDQMGHCVGGYWSRVEGGDTRIVSLRDADGHPHVTIELSRPAEVHVEGRGNLRLMAHLKAGMNQVVASVDWYAAQIRGKQNRVPVPKYAEKVRQWMRDASIPSREEGFAHKAGDASMSIYAVPRDRGFFLTEDVKEAFSVGSEIALAQLETGNATPRTLVRSMHIHEIARNVADDDAVAAFVNAVADSFLKSLRSAHENGTSNILRKVAEGGMEEFVRNCFDGRLLGADPMEGITDFLLSMDEKADVSSIDHVLASVPGGQPLTARIHTVPALGLALLNLGRAAGKEERVLNALEPKLRRVVDAVNREQGVYHVIRSSAAGVRKNDLVQAFFACGLGQNYAFAAAQLPSVVRMRVKEMLVEAKRARVAGLNANVALNLLGDGYEARLTALLREAAGQDSLVIGPQPQKQVALARAAPSPLVKSYPMPRR
ncbi:hypothetical protein HFO56_23700 [Rhizobium laguerreae]|uniref:PcfJ domain-containing protein n=1 Tax=Rhizobium laguerreae TaxID=1076926 RepID=UPI001C90D6EB|nr:PcfJ domain-containing protein [Rhizobium laguerreae]MBY3155332.1 hypothetical protein [Rhizobium laguerreae]